MAAQPSTQKLPAPVPQQALRLSVKEREAIEDVHQVWRRLAMHLLAEDKSAPRRILGITSSIRGEGRTSAAAGLAAAMAAETGEMVLLFEADLRSPGLARQCQMYPTPGIAEFLAGTARLDQSLRQTPIGNLMFAVAGDGPALSAGKKPDTLSTALRRKLPSILADFRKRHGYILLDLPPVLGDVNVEAMARELDGTLLVVRSGAAPVAKVRQAGRVLESAGLVGAIHMAEASLVPSWLTEAISG